MLRFITTICLIYLLFQAPINAKDAKEVCAVNNFVSNDLKNKTLLYLLQPTITSQEELWKFGFRTMTTNNTSIKLPTLQAKLDSTTNLLAYLINKQDNTSKQFNTQINVINLTTLTQQTIFQDSFDDFSKSLRWVDASHLSFMRNSQTEAEYTILDLEGGYENHSTILPQIFDGKNWWFEFSPNAQYGAYFNPKGFDQIVQFMDMRTGKNINPKANIPTIKDTVPRDIAWTNDNKFLILDKDFNWFSINLSEDRVTKLTDVGNTYYLRDPIPAPTSGAIAFKSSLHILNDYNEFVAIWYQGKLLRSCFPEAGQQFRLSFKGWDTTGKYFAFSSSVVENDQVTNSLYVFDIQENSLISVYSGMVGLDVLGWK